MTKEYHDPVEVTCVICGSKFQAKWERRTMAKYCSNKCRYKAASVREQNKQTPKRESFKGIDINHYAEIQKAKTLAMIGRVGR